MGSKHDKSRPQQKIITQRGPLGHMRIADKTPDLEERKLYSLAETAALSKRISFELAQGFEEIVRAEGAALIDVNTFIQELNDQLRQGELSDERLVKCLEGAVFKRLERLYSVLLTLHDQVEQLDTRLSSSLARSGATDQSQANFDKILVAFTLVCQDLKKLGQEATQLHLDVVNSHAAADAAVEAGTNAAQALRQLNDKLNELISRTSRALRDDDEFAGSLQALETRFDEIDQLCKEHAHRTQVFARAQQEYHQQAGRFHTDQEGLSYFEGEWLRAAEAIKQIETLFRLADLDPFVLTFAELGLKHEDLETPPGHDEYEAMAGLKIAPFPSPPSTSTFERAQGLQNTLLQEMEGLSQKTPALQKPPPAPLPQSVPLPVPSSQPTLTIPALHTVAAAFSCTKRGRSWNIMLAMLEEYEHLYGNKENDLKRAFEDACRRHLLEKAGPGNSQRWRLVPERLADCKGLGWFDLFPSKFFTDLSQEFGEKRR